MQGLRSVLGVSVVCALLAGGPASAADETDTTLAILPIAFDGGADAATSERMHSELREGLSRGDFTIVDSANVTSAISGDTCADAACYQNVADQTGATHVVRTLVKIRSRDYQVQMELISGSDGAVVATSSETCEICGLDEAVELISAKAAVLVSQLESLSAGPPVLAVNSTPQGAIVHIDGDAVGKTPFEGKLVAGKHLVRVTKRGFVSVEREITLADGVTSTAEFQLEQVPLAEPAVGKGARPWGWASLGAGIAFLGGGIALLAIDDKPNKGRCEGEEKDEQGDCKFLYNTQWGGASLAVAGAIAGSVGVAILIATRRGSKKKGKNEKQIKAAIGPNSVGIVGRF